MFKLLGGLFGSVVGGYKTILVMLTIVAMLAGGFYWYFKWSQNELTVLRANNAKLEVSVQEQKQTIDGLVKFQKQQNQNVADLQNNLNASEGARKALEEKFLKHDLEYLARNKPVLIEKILNDATAAALNQLEVDTGAKPAATNKTSACVGKKTAACTADPVITSPPLAGSTTP